MKKYLFLAIALLGMASCTKDDIADGNNPIHGGEVETSYIAINLNAADITRAEGGIYQEGLEAERAVKAAYFFFFDAEGNAFPVTATADNPATAPGGSVNWISANLNNVGKEMDNVSDIKDAVLVLSTYKGQYPSQIVAVINWAPSPGVQYDLEDLYGATAIQGNEGGFVMSNAVYSDGTKAVVGAPLTQSNIHKSPADALDKPITIHVERIAAKITVTANGVVNNRFQIKKKTTGNAVLIPLDGNDTEVYVEVTGWELYNDFAQSKLIKDIDPAWDPAELGFTWNDSPFNRSYWAHSLAIGDIDGNTFPTTFSLNVGDTSDVNDGTYAADTYTYVGENTLYDVENKNTANCTKVIIKAKLQKKVGETFEDLKLARWYATYYANLKDLLTAVANTIKYQYYWKDEVNDKYVYIAPEDLTVKKVDNWVAFTLSAEAVDKKWYIRNGDAYVLKTNEDINDLLDDIEKALYYDNAETLYYVDVAHLGYANPGDHVGDYGVVRNHIYNVVLNSFGGLGSPVYNPGGNLVYPNDPLDTGEYVSAEVRVLSWRLVDQVVDIQPN